MRCIHYLIIVLYLFNTSVLCAQTAPGKYWVEFTDKGPIEALQVAPAVYLSPKAIAKRERLSIAYDYRDIPVYSTYLQQLMSVCQCTVQHKSKWFNSVTVQLSDTQVLESIRNLPFVRSLRSVASFHNQSVIVEQKWVTRSQTELEEIQDNSVVQEQYGPSYSQHATVNGLPLHAMGFTGKGIDIAVLDAGWIMADKLPAFSHIYESGRILGTRDFVYPELGVYTLNAHGTYVTSIMAARMSNALIGTAPDANYYLFRTEDPLSEYLVEEDNWVAAAELSDSLGVDIINSSLGYSLFDDVNQNHTYEDMDGNTTRISVAADIAASKGILVVNSAGNSGASPWRYITAPSDGDSVLCVAAMRADSLRAPFSSFGPSSDGDVKPNVAAMGFQTVFAFLDSTARAGNGTSFSAPVISGLAACLMQAFPKEAPMQIFRAIERSANQFQSPDDSFGYGIPDFWKAYRILSGESTWNTTGSLSAVVFPNPCSESLQVIFQHAHPERLLYEIYDATGRRMVEGSGAIAIDGNGYLKLEGQLSRLYPGAYMLHLQCDYDHSVIRFLKQ